MKTTTKNNSLLIIAIILLSAFAGWASKTSGDTIKIGVTCPDDMVVCSDDGWTQLTGASPEGGTYSGIGVGYNAKLGFFFNPNGLKEGEYTITYTVTGLLEGSCSFTIHLYENPTVSCPKDMVAEINDNPFTLTGGSPPGGRYSGPGVVQSFVAPGIYLFHPDNAGIGTHTIQYEYTDSKTRCSASCSFSIQVYEDLQPPVAPTGMNAVALSASSVSLSWSDHADNEDGFKIERQTIGKSAWTQIATVGANVTAYTDHGLSPKVTYAYRVRAYNDAGHSGYSNIAYVTTPPVCPADFPVCQDSEPFVLTGGNPPGGEYIGAGIDYDAGTGAYMLDPGGLAPSTYEMVYQVYEPEPSASCIFLVTVHPTPAVHCPADLSVEIETAVFALTGASPGGGTYAGPGILPGYNEFDAAMAGVGSHTIEYTYTDGGTGCTNRCSFIIEVYEDPKAPLPPSGLIATGVSASQANLTWTDHSGNEDGFEIERRTGHAGAWATIATVGVNVTSYQDGGLSPGKVYGYRVRAYNDIGPSAYSNISEATTHPLCPDSFSMCQDDAPIQIPAAVPAGGIFTGPGISYNAQTDVHLFDPSGLQPGTHELTYMIYDPAASCVFVATVHPIPDVSVDHFDPMCTDQEPLTLTGEWPVGGQWTGPGVAAGRFDPAVAGPGEHELLYTFTSAQGCSNSDVASITVHALPEVDCPDDMLVEVNLEPFTLEGATPLPGSYTGPGVDDEIFDPEAAGVGLHEITYTYTDPETGCTNVCSFQIEVYRDIELLCPDDQLVCADAKDLLLFGASPEGGSYVGSGIYYDDRLTAYVFSPEAAGTGVHEVSYELKFPEDTYSCSFNITVHPLPDVSVDPFDPVCAGTEPIPLSGAKPDGGIWAGSGIEEGIFHPDEAGPGQHEVSYHYTDPESGCGHTVTTVITVHDLPEVICPNDMLVEVGTESLTLNGGIPAGGTFSGTGVSGNVFEPGLAGVGIHTMVYSYTDPDTGCSDTCMFHIEVYRDIEVLCPNDLQVCANDEDITLTGGLPDEGFYAGKGVWYDEVSKSYVFMVAESGPGVFEISYGLRFPEGTYSCTFTITVWPAPEVHIDDFKPVCIDEEPFDLFGGIPAGGQWKGSGVENGRFVPEIAGAGRHQLTYYYTDPESGCSNTATVVFTVNELPEVDCPEVVVIDISTPPFVLSEAKPEGGTYEGPGIQTGNNEFDPAQAGIGSHEIHYSYTDPDTGCTNHCWFVIEVVEEIEVTCPEKIFTCLDWDHVVLEGGEPHDGTYSGEAVSYDEGSQTYIFSPSKAGIGEHEVVYTVTTDHGSYTCRFFVTVDPCTSASFTEVTGVLTIYPNPVRSTIYVDMHGHKQEVHLIRVLDLRGQVVAALNSVEPAERYQVAVGHLPPGLYILQVLTNNGPLVKKFLVAEH